MLVLTRYLPGQTLSTSNLPIVKIETGNQEIPDEPKITARLYITDNGPGAINSVDDPANVYSGVTGIERRGASSAYYPQPSYALETRTETGDEREVDLFGWPAESDWTLISNFNDRSMVRNLLAYRLSQQMGHYAPRARLVEVTLNGGYQGIYLFCERIKRDKGRVDMDKLEPDEVSGADLTGGYIIKVDYFNPSNSWQGGYPSAGRPVHYVYEYPKPENIQPEQKTYIQTFIGNFETALYGSQFADSLSGYRKYIDVPSFIDFLIVQELARNIDGFKKSSHFWKANDSDGGLLHAGPVWDFDWAWKNIDECDIFRATNGSGFSHLVNNCNGDIPAPGWIPRLLQDTFFANRLRCRYKALRENILAAENIYAFIDSVSQAIETAQERHFSRWQILGVNTGTPEMPPIPTSFAGEIDKLKNWIRLRLNWLDKYLPGSCGPPDPGLSPLRVFPNPAYNGEVFVQSRSGAQTHFALYDVAGRQLRPLAPFEDQYGRIEVSGLPAGIYLILLAGYDGKGEGELLKLVVR